MAEQALEPASLASPLILWAMVLSWSFSLKDPPPSCLSGGRGWLVASHALLNVDSENSLLSLKIGQQLGTYRNMLVTPFAPVLGSLSPVFFGKGKPFFWMLVVSRN